ncbi:hypothetical protein JD79_01296 [Geodermatophilus normandii]|uniref:Uncharacterized protein n=1 Tax=Geodermatophilus normandii TaxID=1137989 RepID=A0A317QEE5_9ACTN|nr:hypothetical protein [Geodermatophilus normandii]PWW22148.1 hypothetical protein JD79_01296 [Geodermatophilus normandii]
MLTDRDLDALLAGAAGVSDADLPALPEEFLGQVTADAGLALVTGRTAPGEPASVVAARQLADEARDRRGAGRPRRRRPGRRTLLRVGAAVVAVAAAWTTAVVVTSPGPDPALVPVPSTTAPAVPGGIDLVAAEAVTFPVSVEAPPEGLTPYYSRRGGIAAYGSTPPFHVAAYLDVDPVTDRPGSTGAGQLVLSLYPEDPRSSEEYGFWPEGAPTGTADVDGVRAQVWRGEGTVSLLWERPDGQWVWLSGEGAQARTEALVAVGESIVDRPRPVGLQFGLAPAGWSVGGYEESRSLDLVSDVDPALLLRLSAVSPQYTGALDELLDGMPTAAPVETVVVQGRPGRLALLRGDVGTPPSWTLLGQLPDGRFFRLLAPRELTREQVLQIGEQVTAAP